MENAFTSYLLVYDGSGTPALSRHTQPLHPDTPYLPESSHRQVLLTSGFSSLCADSELPVSPTLQLNGDLGDFSPDQLAQIGRAELDRLHQIRYRSFLQEANPQVVVLGDSASKLHRFMETYGGVLAIDLLLTKGMDPKITTATEITLGSIDNGLKLDFLTPVPVDLSRCSYCRQCGSNCPEHCIHEHLYIDLNRCTYCNKCIHVCPADAIDLYGAERRSVETPALLLLDGTDTELPLNSPLIYQESELPRLFASIFTSQIDETITSSHRLCHYCGRLGLGCSLCSDVCRHGAISRDKDGVTVNQQRCVECGSCVAACPTGAMQLLRFTDQNFVSYCKKLPLEPGCTIAIGTESELHGFWWLHQPKKPARTLFLEYPVPAALSAMHLLLLLCRGAGKVLLLADDLLADDRQVKQVNVLWAELFQAAPPIQHIKREALAEELQHQGTSPLQAFFNNDSFTSRKENLAALLSFLLEQTPAAHQFSGDLFSEFGRIHCDRNSCTLCAACVSECPTQALRADSERFGLLHTPSLCTQCGTCAQICPENALTLEPGLALDEDFFTEKIIARAEPVTCLECGKIFGTRESLAKVTAILSAKGLRDSEDTLLKYCETCRVVQLFETHNT